LGFWRLSNSSWGAAMRAVKDSETAAESIGLNPVAVKTVAFTVSAACAGLAGALFAPLSAFVTPSTFTFSQSILFVLVVMIGGAGTVTGPLAGAALVVLLPEMLAGLAEYRLLFFGALLLVVLWVAPEGVMGEAARFVRRRRVPAPPRPEREALPARPAAASALAVEGLTIAFGGVKAATGVSFSASPGSVTSLIGPNGAGKTTVLNLLGGFYRPDAGTVHLGDQAIERLPAWRIARAGLARTYQTSQLFGSLSVLDNLVIAQARGRIGRAMPSRAQTEARAEALLAFVGYRADMHARASDLAHVDRRHVEIARALATSPSVLLLDEPAAGLGREDKQRLARLLRRIADAGIGVLFVEHDMSVVMEISDHVVVLDAGTPIARGHTARVPADPTER